MLLLSKIDILVPHLLKTNFCIIKNLKLVYWCHIYSQTGILVSHLTEQNPRYIAIWGKCDMVLGFFIIQN